MNGDVTRYESDNLKATAGYGVRKRDLQLVFFDGKLPARADADEMSVEALTADELATRGVTRVSDGEFRGRRGGVNAGGRGDSVSPRRWPETQHLLGPPESVRA